MGKKKLTIVSIVVLVVLIGAFAAVYLLARPIIEGKTQGSKHISVTVEGKDNAETHEITTDAEYLLGALESSPIEISGETGEFGLYVTHVNGVRADYVEDGAYWAFYKNGEYCMNAVDFEPISDGDVFVIKYESA